MTMTLVSTTTLVSTAAAIELTSIPQTGTDLYVVCSIRDAGTGATKGTGITFNSNTGSVYTYKYLQGNGATASSAGSTTTMIQGFSVPASTATASTFSSGTIYITNYAGSTNKSISLDNVTENNATTAHQQINAALFGSTSAITSLKIEAFSIAGFTAGSSVSLYTITKGSGGATVS